MKINKVPINMNDFFMNEINEISLINQKIFTLFIEGVDNETITKNILDHGRTINQETPDHGWISRGFVQYEDIVVPITPEISKLESLILESIARITGKSYTITEMWAVNLVKNQSIIAHSHHSNLPSHPGEYFSIAYYPEVSDDSAELIFSVDWCGHMESTISVKPEVGKLVIFNSYITHMTARQKSESPRIVLSMNLSPVNPSITPNADWSVYWDRPVIN
jgi:hypothetical protein